MNKTSIEFTLRFVNPDELLLGLMLLTLLGILVVGTLMVITSRFFLYEQEGKIKKFSIMHLQLPLSFNKFNTLLTSISDETKHAIKTSLRLDNYFMPCIYLFLFFFSLYTSWFYYRCEKGADCYYFLALPFACWFLDLVENRLISSSLTKVTKTKTSVLLVVSLTKWTIAVLYFLITLYYFFQINKNC